MRSKAKLSSRISNGLIILHTMGGFAYVISTLMTVVDIDVTNRTDELPLAMKMEHPFVIDTRRKYRLVLASSCVLDGGHLGSWFIQRSVSNSDNLHLYSTCEQPINVPLRWLRENGSTDIDKKDDAFLAVITKIIRKQKKLSTLSKILKISFHSSLWCNSNLISDMFIRIYHIVTAIGNPDATEQIVRSLIFFTVTNVEVFIYCFAGEYLSNKNNESGNTAYNSSRYDIKAKNSRNFVIYNFTIAEAIAAYSKMTVLSLECYIVVDCERDRIYRYC
ncbi:uncharacterized protein LOC120358768 [Solenopsis invicta]|uniref:uncharacterized protein LOC120358768 n=1 Tax=Solenopsis invicta TaxID=13686 RepID=UPI00193D90F4|nr:uncharacterized protein LOC120358768 [Solenopsis invicta]